MDDLERQLRSWADAAAPGGAGDPVAPDEVRTGIDVEPAAATSAPRRRGRWLAAAALVVVGVAVAAGVVALVGDDDETEPLDVGTTTSTTEADPLAGPVGFEVLSVADAGRLPPWGKATVARTSGEVAQMWADAGLDAPSPRIDPDEQVVIAMTIADDACAPTLEGFVRDGTTIEPVFVESDEPCILVLVGHTYVVAIDWATVGEAFTFRLPSQPLADLPEVKREVERLPAEPEVEVTWELLETTVAAGDQLHARLVVDNRSGAPIEGTTCGDFFVVRLRGPGVDQAIARTLCASPFVLPEGRSSYDAWGITTRVSCTSTEPALPGVEGCDPGGAPPELPAGTYEALLDQATPGLVPPPDPIEVTIT